MRTAALFLNAVAILAALYDSKILVWDIAVADVRQASGGRFTVAFAVLVSAAFVSLPALLGMRWALAGRPGASLAVALLSLALSAGGFVILASAFTP
jgi:hypothetical protein